MFYIIYFILWGCVCVCVCVCVYYVTSVVFYSILPYGLQAANLLCPWDSPGNNTGAGPHALLQGIFLTWGLNLFFYITCIGGWVLYH